MPKSKHLSLAVSSTAVKIFMPYFYLISTAVRFESYYNSCNLFNFSLSPEKPVTLDLPNQWLWEIIDEFIYQFQAFQQFRSKLQKKSGEEIEMLKHNLRTWDVLQVSSLIMRLQKTSKVWANSKDQA